MTPREHRGGSAREDSGRTLPNSRGHVGRGRLDGFGRRPLPTLRPCLVAARRRCVSGRNDGERLVPESRVRVRAAGRRLPRALVVAHDGQQHAHRHAGSNDAGRHAVELHADDEARLPLRDVHGAHEPRRRHRFRWRHDQWRSAIVRTAGLHRPGARLDVERESHPAVRRRRA